MMRQGMSISTKTILVLGLVQCILLTLFFLLFLRYEKTTQSDQNQVPKENLTTYQ